MKGEKLAYLPPDEVLETIRKYPGTEAFIGLQRNPTQAEICVICAICGLSGLIRVYSCPFAVPNLRFGFVFSVSLWCNICSA